MSNRIIHFDLYADDPARASKFYSEVFGWTFKKWEGEGMDYWLIMTGPDIEPGIDGGMSKREKEWKDNVSNGAVTIGVSNVDEAISKIEKAGGEITMKKTALSGVGWFASFKDPEGNVLALMQADMSAM
ncbi:MAG: Glyoxalase/bleomycin resistance protein/dioxygenase [Candidatus Moranbacteria bacterium GW2011_GWF2_36_839]|nr:MAG: Glyoxalase/bleomycin resistance protein/dioxygenase [Candidatus Moranbacteria bacterium GW2011_GWF1_36_78]KKQ17369.1 MAG: Glyoxalase/bleomycin resistance protein/dioxygenase [Candidatus Moranbacteria bacterium GW2011_GWF2_36_839]HAT73789.1 glyoxalase [Candidatus Moranbacteria bacterium]HBY11068.1 glyoxalase [Candidatus Moranbacteria bacterium]